MPSRGTSYGIALGAACFVFIVCMAYGWTTFNSYQTQHLHERQRALEFRKDMAGKELSGCRVPAPCVDGSWVVPSEQKVESPDYLDYYNLKAQQDMAEWTYSLLWVGTLGLIATLIGIGFVFENLREIRRQSSIQKEVGENQVKAYLWVSEASLHVSDSRKSEGSLRHPSPSRAIIILKVVNNGQTPALEISASATLSSSKANGQNALAGIMPPRFTAKSTSETKVDAVMAGETEPDLFLFFPFEHQDEVANALSTDWAAKYGVENIHISGAVTYKDVFGHIYESEFAFNGLLKETISFEAMHPVKKGKSMFRKTKDASGAR